MSLEQKLDSMRGLYLDTERQLQEFIHIIPIDNNPEVYSPRLYSILQFSCAQIDSLFKIICQYLNISVKKEERNFPGFHRILNAKGMLEIQEVFLFHRKQMIHPFNKTEEHLWWTAYNDTKHQLPEGIRQGTLGNVIDAIAATYVLNNIANLTRYVEYADDLFDSKKWHSSHWNDFSPTTIMMMNGINTQSPIKKSEFFYLNSQYHRSGTATL